MRGLTTQKGQCTNAGMAMWILIASIGLVLPVRPTLADMQVNVIADRAQAFVNQQILLTVRVEAPVEAFSITGDSLQIADARLQPTEKTQQIREVNARAFRETVTVYSLFVPSAGTVRVPSLTFRAQLPVPVLEDGTRASGGNPRITARSEPLAIEIAPPPDTDRVWFTASEVQIESTWQQPADQIVVGEPFIRDITVTAAGQYAAAIPPVTFAENPVLRRYPATADLSEHEDAAGLTGVQRQSITLLATRPGSIELPALALDWWDTDEQVWRIARTPAQTITVQSAGRGDGLSQWYPRLLWALALLSVLLAIAVIALWRQLRHLRPRQTAMSAGHRESREWWRLRGRLRAASVAEIRLAIVAWASAGRPDLTSIEALAIAYPTLAPMLQRLDQALYADNAPDDLSPVERKRLYRELRLARKQRRRLPKPAELPALYPQS